MSDPQVDGSTPTVNGPTSGQVAASVGAVVVLGALIAAGVSGSFGGLGANADGGVIANANNGLGLDGGVPPNAIRFTPAALADAGETLAYNVYSATDVDGGKVPTAILRDGGLAFLTAFPCARRDAGQLPITCKGKFPDGGLYEQGDDNVMQPGGFVGVGCVPCPCVIFFGDEPP